MARLFATELKLPVMRNAFSPQNYLRLKNDILALMFTQMLNRFDLEQDSDGKPWEPLKSQQFERRNKKIKDKSRKGNIKILQDDGTLRKSFTIEGAEGNETSVSGDEVYLATTVPYAAAHNDGLRIKHPGTSDGFGRGIKIDPYFIQLPERRMTGFSDDDVNEIRELIAGHMSEEGF
ncbi:MAG: hypothetical protein CMB99_15915 [Flavobacteriaceae bacterium]|jgi:phage gpG-like protein|nr:hypothetical protein [Flavobacteriaceae bacterium]|tara:strand:+ start:7638 stop:8168 length:531 start_codon:yes stop_codon:yes gene_type:complete